MSRSSSTCSNGKEDGYIIQFMRHVFILLSSCVELLQQILDEMRTSNNALSEKVLQLEKVVTDMQAETTPSRRKTKLLPSREERVSQF